MTTQKQVAGARNAVRESYKVEAKQLMQEGEDLLPLVMELGRERDELLVALKYIRDAAKPYKTIKAQDVAGWAQDAIAKVEGGAQ